MKFLITFSYLLLTLFCCAQGRIEGVYNYTYRTFIPNANIAASGSGKEVYDVGSFENGCALITYDHKTGWIDSVGTIIIPLHYSKLERCGYKILDYFRFETSSTMGLVTKKGEQILEIQAPVKMGNAEGIVAANSWLKKASI